MTDLTTSSVDARLDAIANQLLSELAEVGFKAHPRRDAAGLLEVRHYATETSVVLGLSGARMTYFEHLGTHSEPRELLLGFDPYGRSISDEAIHNIAMIARLVAEAAPSSRMGRAVTEDNRIPEIRAVLTEFTQQAWALPGPLRDALERIDAILDSAPPADGSCPDGECNQGMCGGTSDPAGPCGGCCACLSGCLDAGPPLRASEERAIPEPTEGQNP